MHRGSSESPTAPPGSPFDVASSLYTAQQPAPQYYPNPTTVPPAGAQAYGQVPPAYAHHGHPPVAPLPPPPPAHIPSHHATQPPPPPPPPPVQPAPAHSSMEPSSKVQVVVQTAGTIPMIRGDDASYTGCGYYFFGLIIGLILGIFGYLFLACPDSNNLYGKRRSHFIWGVSTMFLFWIIAAIVIGVVSANNNNYYY